MIINYNEKSNHVVFAWGDTRYGKLGHGRVPEYLEKRQAKIKAKLRETTGVGTRCATLALH